MDIFFGWWWWWCCGVIYQTVFFRLIARSLPRTSFWPCLLRALWRGARNFGLMCLDLQTMMQLLEFQWLVVTHVFHLCHSFCFGGDTDPQWTSFETMFDMSLDNHFTEFSFLSFFLSLSLSRSLFPSNNSLCIHVYIILNP